MLLQLFFAIWGRAFMLIRLWASLIVPVPAWGSTNIWHWLVCYILINTVLAAHPDVCWRQKVISRQDKDELALSPRYYVVGPHQRQLSTAFTCSWIVLPSPLPSPISSPQPSSHPSLLFKPMNHTFLSNASVLAFSLAFSSSSHASFLSL